MVGHFKLKLWAFFWGQGEREWPLYNTLSHKTDWMTRIEFYTRTAHVKLYG